MNAIKLKDDTSANKELASFLFNASIQRQELRLIIQDVLKNQDMVSCMPRELYEKIVLALGRADDLDKDTANE